MTYLNKKQSLETREMYLKINKIICVHKETKKQREDNEFCTEWDETFCLVAS